MHKYQDSISKSQITDNDWLVFSTIYITLILSLNKTISLIDTGIVKNFIIFSQF